MRKKLHEEQMESYGLNGMGKGQNFYTYGERGYSSQARDPTGSVLEFLASR